MRGTRTALSAEQAVARVLLRVGSISAATGCFHLCVPAVAPFSGSGSGLGQGQGEGPRGVFLRVVSKDYRVALPEPCPPAGAGSGPGTARRWAAAVKVSFSVQTAAPAAAPGAGAGAGAAAGATKAYARVPLQPHELDEVRCALLRRSALFGPSVIGGDALSVLLV